MLTTLLRWLCVLAVLAAWVASASEALAARPTLSVRPAAVPAGGAISIQGAGWAGPGGKCGRVTLRAYVPDLSPYPAARIGATSVGGAGRFRVEWTTPKVVDRLTWRIEAVQVCREPRRIVLRFAPVRIG